MRKLHDHSDADDDHAGKASAGSADDLSVEADASAGHGDGHDSGQAGSASVREAAGETQAPAAGDAQPPAQAAQDGASDAQLHEYEVRLPAIVSALSLLLSPAPTYRHPPQVLPYKAPIGVLRIPAIGLSTRVVEGSMKMYNSANLFLPELDHGPAAYPANYLPWQKGTVVISGHRITHTHPFRDLGSVRLGESILVATRWGSFRYRIRQPPAKPGYVWNSYAVSTSPCTMARACAVFSAVKPDGRPRNAWVFTWHERSGHWLVLAACTPKGDDAFRLLVFAQMVSVAYGPLTLPVR